MTKAYTLFTAVPKKHNCAQAVMAGCWGTEEAVKKMAMCGGVHAPGGLCGALYAVLQLCPTQAEAIKTAFVCKVGAMTCHEIKTHVGTPCSTCVETAACLALACQHDHHSSMG